MSLLEAEIEADLAVYVASGRRPEGFARALLLGDRDAAWDVAPERFCHPGYFSPATRVDEFLRFVADAVPEEARGSAEAIDRWVAHRGLQGAPARLAVLIRLRHEDRFWER